jgi:iron complex transport system permease protein
VWAGLAAVLLIAAGLRIGLNFWAGFGVGEGEDGAGVGIARALLELRSMRVGSGAVTGAALAVAGVLLQALLRNPLAAPDVLGLSAGSGLGVMIVAYAAYRAGEGIAHVGAWSAPAAVVGGLGALAVVYMLGQRRGVVEPVSLILVGVVVSILCGSAMELIRHLMPDQGLAVSRLLMGAVRDVPFSRLAASAGALAVGLVIAMALARAMDAAELSDDEAKSVGVRLDRLRLVLFVVAGVLTAASVLLTGAIGFIGLVAPHVARLLVGAGHRTLIPTAALVGATLVVLADALARAIDLGSGPLPVGVLTTIIGGPVLVWMLRGQMRRA